MYGIVTLFSIAMMDVISSFMLELSRDALNTRNSRRMPCDACATLD
jgi:hypothetical protein